MCDVSLGFFAKGVALRDAIASVSRAVQSSAGGQAPTVVGSPDALPSTFCINPRSGAAGGSGGAEGGTDAGKGKTREADKELLALLRETGMEKEVDRLAGHGVYCVEDVKSLREEDLAKLGLRFRKLLDHVKSFQAHANAFLMTILSTEHVLKIEHLMVPPATLPIRSAPLPPGTCRRETVLQSR